ncbi:unnamed protein product [Urochloa humidicola]
MDPHFFPLSCVYGFAGRRGLLLPATVHALWFQISFPRDLSAIVSGAFRDGGPDRYVCWIVAAGTWFLPQPGLLYSPVCVRVTRKWEYRDPADDSVVQHIDLVVADKEGNAMHAEIPQEVLNDFINHKEEGHIYEMRRFRVANAKSFYKP